MAHPTTNSATRRSEMAGPSGMSTYTFDPAGNPRTVVDPCGKTTTLTYNGNNQAVRKQLPNGTTVSHVYNPAGWLKPCGFSTVFPKALFERVPEGDLAGHRVVLR